MPGPSLLPHGNERLDLGHQIGQFRRRLVNGGLIILKSLVGLLPALIDDAAEIIGLGILGIVFAGGARVSPALFKFSLSIPTLAIRMWIGALLSSMRRASTSVSWHLSKL